MKILVWDGTGLVLVYKRLEQGSFAWPKVQDGVMRLSPVQFEAQFEAQFAALFAAQFEGLAPYQ